jgi:hypothetical protein
VSTGENSPVDRKVTGKDGRQIDTSIARNLAEVGRRVSVVVDTLGIARFEMPAPAQ